MHSLTPKKIPRGTGENNHQRPLLELPKSFCRFHDRYKQFFTTKTRSVVAQARQYLSGLMQAVRKNVGRMTEVVPEKEYQSLQHFTSHSPCEHRPVMDQVTLDADRLSGGSLDSALILDESSIPKKREEVCRRSPPMVRPSRQGR